MRIHLSLFSAVFSSHFTPWRQLLTAWGTFPLPSSGYSSSVFEDKCMSTYTCWFLKIQMWSCRDVEMSLQFAFAQFVCHGVFPCRNLWNGLSFTLIHTFAWYGWAIRYLMASQPSNFFLLHAMLQGMFHIYIFNRCLEVELLVLMDMHILHFDRCWKFLLRKEYTNLFSLFL